jgi:putative aminopeptidase FrvX
VNEGMGLNSKLSQEIIKMFGKIKIALSAAVILSIACPASAAMKHHHSVTHVFLSRPSVLLL